MQLNQIHPNQTKLNQLPLNTTNKQNNIGSRQIYCAY